MSIALGYTAHKTSLTQTSDATIQPNCYMGSTVSANIITDDGFVIVDDNGVDGAITRCIGSGTMEEVGRMFGNSPPRRAIRGHVHLLDQRPYR
jgi:hypothetical protein